MSELTITYDSEGNNISNINMHFIHAIKALMIQHTMVNVQLPVIFLYKLKAVVNNKICKRKYYCSDILINPTCKDLLIIANDIVEYAKCWDRHFFEGFVVIGLIDDDIIEIDLSLGS